MAPSPDLLVALHLFGTPGRKWTVREVLDIVARLPAPQQQFETVARFIDCGCELSTADWQEILVLADKMTEALRVREQLLGKLIRVLPSTLLSNIHRSIVSVESPQAQERLNRMLAHRENNSPALNDVDMQEECRERILQRLGLDTENVARKEALAAKLMSAYRVNDASQVQAIASRIRDVSTSIPAVEVSTFDVPAPVEPLHVRTSAADEWTHVEQVIARGTADVDALCVLRGIRDDHSRAYGLYHLLPTLPAALLPDVLAHVCPLRRADDRNALLNRLAPRLAAWSITAPPHTVHKAWITATYRLAAHGRPALLADFAILLPWLAAFTTAEERISLAEYLEQIAHCWP
jgi:hypothetical protein